MSDSRRSRRADPARADNLDRRYSLSGPGELTAELAAPSVLVSPPDPVAEGSLAELAFQHGLRPSAARPTAAEYFRQLWARRHFIVAFATARNVAMYSEARLGQVWQILTPLLNAVVYFLIFGLILGTSRGVSNFIPFLVIGVFVFNFTQRSVIISSRVINDSLPLIRALPFPRACLPLGYVLIELQQMIIAMLVLCAIVLGFGEPLTWHWALVIPALALQTIFNIGVGLILARIGAGVEDVSQLIPFIVRTWMYAAGVMFAIPTLHALYLHTKISLLMQINPAAVYIELMRNAMMSSWRSTLAGYAPYNRHLCAKGIAAPTGTPKAVKDAFLNHCHYVVADHSLWVYGIGWAVFAVVIGYFVFWQAEVTYGRG